MEADRQRSNDRRASAAEEDESMIDSDDPTRRLTPGDHRDGADAGTDGRTGDVDSSDMSRFRARACARCSRSKLRCIRRVEPGAEPCLRCARLGTECTLPEARPRGPKKGQARRVGQLEQKLDGIMSLLTASQQLLNQNNAVSPNVPAQASSVTSPISEGGLTDDPSQAKAPASIPTSRPPQQQQVLPFFPRHDLAATTPDSTDHRSAPSPVTSNSTGAASQHDGSRTLSRLPANVTSQTVELWPGFDITWREAARVMNVYSALYLPNFPFVPIPKDLPPEELFAATPFLFRTIMLVAAPQSAPTQRAAEKWFRKSIAESVVALGEKRLELLQSLLLFISWGDYRFYMESKATSLLQIAVGLVLDLGLNKAPLAVNNLAPYSLLNEALRRHPHLRGKSAHSRDDMRAMLGCFYVTSQITTLFRREHNLPYTEFMDKCAAELAGTEEYATDKMLVGMVKMQCLVRRAHAVMSGASPEPGANAPFTTAAAMALAAIRRELYEPTSGYSAMDDRSKHMLKMHCHASLVTMHEPVIYSRSSPPLTATPDMGPASINPPGGKRTDALWHCLRALIDFIQLYIAMPNDQAGTMAIFPAANLAFSFVTITRLLFIDDAEWDATEARKHFDFPGIAQRMIEKYSAAEAYETGGGSSDGGGPGAVQYRRRYHEDGNSLMETFMLKTRWLMQWYLAKTTPGSSSITSGYGLDSALRPLTRQSFESCLAQEQQQPQQQQQQQQQPRQMPVQKPHYSAQYPVSQPQQPVYGGDPMVGFDATSFLEDFDDSFWHAFLSVDSQLAYPPMVAGSMPRPI